MIIKFLQRYINLKADNMESTNKYIKVLNWFGIFLWTFFCGIAISCMRLVSWTFQNWGNLKADELIYTLTANLSGTNLAMVKSGILYCVP